MITNKGNVTSCTELKHIFYKYGGNDLGNQKRANNFCTIFFNYNIKGDDLPKILPEDQKQAKERPPPPPAKVVYSLLLDYFSQQTCLSYYKTECGRGWWWYKREGGGLFYPSVTVF